MPENLSDLWLAQVQQAPHAAALIESETGRIWTRAQLEEAAERWARNHAPSTNLKGQRVALAEPNSAGWLTVFIALQRLGAVPVPLDPAEPKDARLSSASSAKARWLWADNALVQLTSRKQRAVPGVCLVKLTSGSTGTPQPLSFTHAQMIADGRQVCSTMGIGSADLNLGIIPFGHSYGLGNLIIPLLVQGTALVAAASPLPHALAEACRRWKPTVFPAVPTLLRALSRSEVEPSDISSLRLIISAGAPLAAEVAHAFASRFGVRIHSFYGSSETGGITYDRDGEATLLGRSVGQPVDGVSLAFRTSGRFEVSSAAVLGKGRHSPPDRGCLNQHGELVLQGRTGRTAKIAGRRVDLSEVEKLIRSVPGVVDAMAAAHPSRADAIAAAVSGTAQAEAIRQALRTRTALWKIPERILVMPELPLTARGKVDRKKVLALLNG